MTDMGGLLSFLTNFLEYCDNESSTVIERPLWYDVHRIAVEYRIEIQNHYFIYCDNKLRNRFCVVSALLNKQQTYTFKQSFLLASKEVVSIVY